MRGLAPVALVVAGLAALPAVAQPVETCDPAALHGPDLTRCLTEAAKESEAALGAAIEAALASIRTREGVFDTQRARWRNSLADSQGLWLRWRNAECQEVAPFARDRQPWFNHYWRLFRATDSTAKLTISDWSTSSDPGGPVGQELLYNFVEVQPYFEAK